MADSNRVIEVVIRAVDKATGVFKALAKGAVIGFGALVGAVGSAGYALKKMVDEASAAEQVAAKLDAVLASTGGTAGVTAQMANDLANSLMQVTRFEDEAILSAETMLLRFKGIGKDIFPEVTEATLDLAESLGTDLNSASRLLGKALETPGVGLLRLKMAGVAFNETQLETIKGMAEAGDLAGAQRLILDELKKSVGGTARAMGNTLAGKLEILKNTMGNLKETIGGALIPVLTELATRFIEALNNPLVQAWVEKFAKWLGMVPQMVKNVASAFSTWWGGTIGPVLSRLRTTITGKVLPAIREWVEWGGQKLGDAWATLKTVWTGTLQPILVGIWNKITNDVLPAVKRFISEGWEKLQSVWGNVKTWYDTNIKATLDDLYGKLVNDVIPKLKEWAQWSGEKLGEAWDKVKGWWTNTLQPVLIELYNKLTDDVIPRIVEWVNKLKEEIPLAFAVAKASYDKDMKPLLEDMGVKMATIHERYMKPWADFLTTEFPAGLTVLGASFQTNVLDKLGIYAALLPTSSGGTDLFSTALLKLRNAFLILNPGLGIAAWLFSDLEGNLRTLWSLTIVAFLNALDILGQKIDAALGPWLRLKEQIEGFKSVIEGISKSIDYKSFEDIGKGMVDGIKAGISAKWEQFRNWFSREIRAIVHNIMQELGIHSPSKVFANIGEQMAAGLVSGWSSGLSGFQAQLSPSLNLAGMGGAASAGASYKSVGGDTNNFYVNDQATGGLIAAMIDERRRNRLNAFMGV